MRRLIKLAAWLGGIFAVLFVILVLAVMRVPTAQDARASDQIRLDFVQVVSTNLPAAKQVTIVSSPRRGATMIFVSGGSLTDDEKQSLRVSALQIGKMRDNRPVTVVFRD